MYILLPYIGIDISINYNNYSESNSSYSLSMINSLVRYDLLSHAEVILLMTYSTFPF